MLDDNLPTFFLQPSENQRYTTTLYLRHHGEEPEPAYSLRHLDPSLPNSKHHYAIAISDPFTTDILFGEVLIIPEWSNSPSPPANSKQEPSGLPPAPEPVLPSQFKIQLYNPDQEVVVHYKPKTWNSSASWDFEIPQQSFRQPSTSSLDRTQSDPAALDATPKLRFLWRKDGPLSKDFACFLSGRSAGIDGRKKDKEPDIALLIFKGFKEITLYEPNLSRVEIEDFKGLELVLLLSAIVIRDVYSGQLKDAFHISSSTPINGNLVSDVSRPTTRPQIVIPGKETQHPRMDARSKWELEAEAAALKKQQEAEARERRRREQEAERMTRQMLEAEEKTARLRQAEIDKETERLKKIYGQQGQDYRTTQSSSVPPPLPGPRPSRQQPQQPPSEAAPRYFNTTSHLEAPSSEGPFNFSNSRPRPYSSLSYYNTTTGALQPPQPRPQQVKPKRSSFFGSKKGVEEASKENKGKLQRKRSSVF